MLFNGHLWFNMLTSFAGTHWQLVKDPNRCYHTSIMMK